MTLRADAEVVDGKAAIVERAFRLLDEIEQEGRERFLAADRNLYAALHALQESVEAALDVAGHIVASSGFRHADDYSDLFAVLAEEGVLEDDLAEPLQEMARFRNLVVHRYDEIDPKRVWDIVREDRHDVAEFFTVVFDALED